MSGELEAVPRAMAEVLEGLAVSDEAASVLRIVAAWLRSIRELPRMVPLRAEERPAEVQAGVIAVHGALLDETVDNVLAQKPGIPGRHHGDLPSETVYAEGWREGQAWLARTVRNLPRHPVRG